MSTKPYTATELSGYYAEDKYNYYFDVKDTISYFDNKPITSSDIRNDKRENNTNKSFILTFGKDSNKIYVGMKSDNDLNTNKRIDCANWHDVRNFDSTDYYTGGFNKKRKSRKSRKNKKHKSRRRR